MNRREEILITTLELAAEHGLSNVSLSQIADKIGIKKPSLYNHFKSKDEIITAMYEYFREASKEQLALTEIDYGQFVKKVSMEEALTFCVSNYMNMTGNSQMLLFYKVIYSERSTNPEAAKIMAEETQKMLIATKNLFYALKVHEKINVNDIDMTATSFAMSIHAMMDYRLDCESAWESVDGNMIQDYIKWFCTQFETVV